MKGNSSDYRKKDNGRPDEGLSQAREGGGGGEGTAEEWCQKQTQPDSLGDLFNLERNRETSLS